METLVGFLAPVLLGIGLALLLTSPFLIVIFIRFLAERDIFFTLVEEGQAKALVRNQQFRKMVMAYQGYKLNDDKTSSKRWDLELRTKTEKKLPWFEEKLGGVRWLGWPYLDTVYEYNFRWTVLRESQASEDEDGFVTQRKLLSGKWVVSFAKRIDYILLKDFVYYNELIGAETGGTITKKGEIEAELMPVDVLMLIPIRIINPYKALFLTHKWLDTSLDLIKPSVRSRIATLSYQEVIRKKEVAEREFDEFLKMDEEKTKKETEIDTDKEPKSKSISEYLEDTYGVRVKRVTFEDVIPPKEYSDAATNRAKAEQRKKEIETLAKAEAERVKTSFDPILERGEAGLAIRALEAVEKASQGPGNTVITVGPGLVKELVGLVSGVKVPKGEVK